MKDIEFKAADALISAQDKRIKKLEAALGRFADDELWGYNGYWHEWHGSDDPKAFARAALESK